MKRPVVLSCVFVLLFGLSGAASATTIINYNYALDGNGFTSPYAGHVGVIVEDFNDASLVGTWTGNRALVSGSLLNKYAAPGGKLDSGGEAIPDGTQYMTVPENKSTGISATVVFNTTYNYFGIWWGSIDTYNKIEFYLGNSAVPVASYTGSAVSGGPYGDQTSPLTNLYVNFLNLPNFNKVVFTSTEYAYEFDNIAVGNVHAPIPGAVWLLGSGLLGLLGFRRKFAG